MELDPVGRVALVFRGDRHLRDDPAPAATRLGPLFDALTAVGLAPEWAVYDEDFAEEFREQLLRVDGVLVWVDPVTGTKDRTHLDALLREVAAAGVWVSAHPDVILKIGTKEVIYRTRELGWGTDTHLYATYEDFADQFPARLGADGSRVLKQYRGNGGIGVWKVVLLGDSESEATPSAESLVRVQNGRLRDEVIDELTLGAFIARCRKYFDYSGGAGRLVDQAFQSRITEGATRCYLSRDKVVGFCRQYAPGRSPADEPGSGPPADLVMGLPSEKTMFGSDEPSFQMLRTSVEDDWVPAMLNIVGMDADSLPAIWDADFLFGPKTTSHEVTYVLSEINVSAVLPFPDQALPPIAKTAHASVIAAKALRG